MTNYRKSEPQKFDEQAKCSLAYRNSFATLIANLFRH